MVQLGQNVSTPMQRVLRTAFDERNARFDLLSNVQSIGICCGAPLSHQHCVQRMAKNEVHDIVAGVRCGAVEQDDDASPGRREGSHSVGEHFEVVQQEDVVL